MVHLNKTLSEKIILGVDPGTNILGYGIIEVKAKKINLLKMDIIHLKKVSTHELKIKIIFDTMIQIIDQFHPDYLAIEAPFFGKNVQSMLKLGRAQGVTIAAALSREIPFTEYSPKKIKQSITGNGNATKEQVAIMLSRLLDFKEIPEFLDATDGLAAAYCHFLQNKLETPISNEPTPQKPMKKSGSWNDFISKNPSRIK